MNELLDVKLSFGMVLSMLVSLMGVAYSAGVLGSRVSALETSFVDIRAKTSNTDDRQAEILQKLTRIETHLSLYSPALRRILEDEQAAEKHARQRSK